MVGTSNQSVPEMASDGNSTVSGWAAVRIESSLGSTWVTFIEPRQRMLHCTMPPWEHDVEKSMRVCPDWVRAFGPVCPACQRSVLADEPSNGQHFPGGADSMESPRRGSFHDCGVLRPWTLASMLGAMALGDCRSSPWNNISACSVRSQTMPS